MVYVVACQHSWVGLEHRPIDENEVALQLQVAGYGQSQAGGFRGQRGSC